jgi:hypothetical protein
MKRWCCVWSQEHTRLKQQCRSRQHDWTQWVQSTAYAGAAPSTGGFIGAARYTTHTLDVHQKAPAHVQPASQQADARMHLMELQARTQQELDRRGGERVRVSM